MTLSTGFLTLSPGRHRAALRAALDDLARRRFLERFLRRDPSLWKDDPAHAEVITSRLGWLDSAGEMLGRCDELTRFAGQLRAEGIRHMVLLGMGGSSLCPDVLRATFRRGRGAPALAVLDSTDPEAIAAVERSIRLDSSLFIVASKSGTTLESRVLQQYFLQKAPASRFVAITDPGTPLEAASRELGFRRAFLNRPDIGGRYSALSCFGMVPAAGLGLDVRRLLSRGHAVIEQMRASRRPEECPPVVLGAALGALARAGRDKITFFASERIASFGYWVEQLIAESTGKEGRGLVPVEGEAPGGPASYGKDRLFVHLRLRGSRDAAIARRLAALGRAGHPILTVTLEDPYDLGAEFNRWEIATSVAGALLGINPFDEPNVKESKDNTSRVLREYNATRALPTTAPDLAAGSIRAWVGSLPAPRARPGLGATPEELLMETFCREARPGDYIAVMAYLRMAPATRRALDRLRLRLRDRTRLAVTVGFGPRFLHSTGQLHKGGAGNGLFLQITSDKRLDLAIPGETYTFGVLQAAQAAGDFLSLAGRRYRVMRLHLGGDPIRQIDRLTSAVRPPARSRR